MKLLDKVLAFLKPAPIERPDSDFLFGASSIEEIEKEYREEKKRAKDAGPVKVG